MMIKAVLLFLVLAGLLGMFGRRRRPPAQRDGRSRIERARKCPACGTYLVGEDPCPCGGGGRAAG
jgi:hypothetical protein